MVFGKKHMSRVYLVSRSKKTKAYFFTSKSGSRPFLLNVHTDRKTLHRRKWTQTATIAQLVGRPLPVQEVPGSLTASFQRRIKMDYFHNRP